MKNNKDCIFIKNINTESVIGIHDFERIKAQRLVISVTLHTSIIKAAEYDDIQYALDYDAISRWIDDFAKNSEFQLIEAMAEGCVKGLFNEFPLIDAIIFDLQKPGAIQYTQEVGLSIYRERK